ncbi:hypothetical protein KGF56_003167 [Candida oxycetoniae]|uniref:Flavoprotein domain-containing protein n=1 Tax=Candida oxycetoniae TaxID=497107 RepID=A0AAI9SVS6_9ASCO|nr:uncharacterized protein KGF56_003167 [Candida oxycetoniae]KAI3404008.1 hypothetical protein KGF56_003167 [Candida oxycetoniae]
MDQTSSNTELNHENQTEQPIPRRPTGVIQTEQPIPRRPTGINQSILSSSNVTAEALPPSQQQPGTAFGAASNITQPKRAPSFRTAITNTGTNTPPPKILTNSSNRVPTTSGIHSPQQSTPFDATSRPNFSIRNPSVSFSDIDSQERLRRFTISSQPSSTSVHIQQNDQHHTSLEKDFINTPSLHTSIQQSSTLSNVPSRQSSLNRKKNALNNDSGLLFTGKTLNLSSGAATSSQSSLEHLSLDAMASFEGLSKSQSLETGSGRNLNSPSPPPFERIPSNVSAFSPTYSVSNISSSVVPIKINGTGTGAGTAIGTGTGTGTGTGSNSSSRRGSIKKSNKTIVASPVGPPVPFQEYLHKQDDGKFHILLGCTGSVATIKVPLIIDKLFQIFGASKISIQLIVTKSASHFLRGSKINADVKIWRDEDEWTNYSKAYATTTSTTSSTQNLSVNKKPKNPYETMILHNELRKWADIMLVAPLSANTLAKIANGISDNLLTSIIRSWSPTTAQQVKKPLIAAPAMNTFMYTHPITAKQLACLSSPEFGIEILKPVEKILVCGDIGMGGMREWTDVVDILRRKIIAVRTERKKLDEAIGNLVEEEEEEEEEDEDEDDEEDDEEDDDETRDNEDENNEDDDEDDEDDDDVNNGNSEENSFNINSDMKRRKGANSESIEELQLNNIDEGNEEMIFEITDQEHSEGEGSGDSANAGLSPTLSHRQQRITIPKETKNII